MIKDGTASKEVAEQIVTSKVKAEDLHNLGVTSRDLVIANRTFTDKWCRLWGGDLQDSLRARLGNLTAGVLTCEFGHIDDKQPIPRELTPATIHCLRGGYVNAALATEFSRLTPTDTVIANMLSLGLEESEVVKAIERHQANWTEPFVALRHRLNLLLAMLRSPQPATA